MARGISIREFARRDGCSDTLVRRAISAGALKTFADGTLNEKLVGTGWRSANRRGANTTANNRATKGAPDPGVRNRQAVEPQLEPQAPGGISRHQAPVASDETPDEAAERILAQMGAALSLAEAERVKENYLALLRQLEYDLKSGQVVLIAEVTRAVAAEYARCRTRLLAIGAELAPRLHQCRTVAEVQDLLQAVIAEALEELTRDGAAPAG